MTFLPFLYKVLPHERSAPDPNGVVLPTTTTCAEMSRGAEARVIYPRL